MTRGSTAAICYIHVRETALIHNWRCRAQVVPALVPAQPLRVPTPWAREVGATQNNLKSCEDWCVWTSLVRFRAV